MGSVLALRKLSPVGTERHINHLKKGGWACGSQLRGYTGSEKGSSNSTSSAVRQGFSEEKKLELGLER